MCICQCVAIYMLWVSLWCLVRGMGVCLAACVRVVFVTRPWVVVEPLPITCNNIYGMFYVNGRATGMDRDCLYGTVLFSVLMCLLWAHVVYIIISHTMGQWTVLFRGLKWSYAIYSGMSWSSYRGGGAVKGNYYLLRRGVVSFRKQSC